MTEPKRLPLPEFVAVIAMQFAMVAFSIDAMLPALPEIAKEISPDNRNQAQLVITAFLFGLGLGTFFTGPLSDTWGRKRVIIAGVGLFVIGCWLAGRAQTLDTMLAARVLQGVGVAAPRVVTLAIVRDLYTGRRMAQIMSYAMLVFTLVPAMAPFIGSLIIDAFGWRAIYTTFMIFALVTTSWLMLRQPETLPVEKRRTFRLATLWQATRECFSHRVFVISTLAQVLSFGMLFGTISSTQQVFDQAYGRGDSFPLWFAGISLVGGMASVLNARLVMALGMRRMIEIGFGGQFILSMIVVTTSWAIGTPFWMYLIWTTSLFFMVGLVIGNLNALAMEPVGHIAGLAASVIGGVSTVSAVFIAGPVGLMFDGTPLPLALSLTVLSLTGFLLIRRGLR